MKQTEVQSKGGGCCVKNEGVVPCLQFKVHRKVQVWQWEYHQTCSSDICQQGSVAWAVSMPEPRTALPDAAFLS
jgi:hypothetical protein